MCIHVYSVRPCGGGTGMSWLMPGSVTDRRKTMISCD